MLGGRVVIRGARTLGAGLRFTEKTGPGNPFSVERDADETLAPLVTSKGHNMNRNPRSFDTMTLLQTAPVVLLAIWVLTVILRSL